MQKEIIDFFGKSFLQDAQDLIWWAKNTDLSFSRKIYVEGETVYLQNPSEIAEDLFSCLEDLEALSPEIINTSQTLLLELKNIMQSQIQELTWLRETKDSVKDICQGEMNLQAMPPQNRDIQKLVDECELKVEKYNQKSFQKLLQTNKLLKDALATWPEIDEKVVEGRFCNTSDQILFKWQEDLNSKRKTLLEFQAKVELFLGINPSGTGLLKGDILGNLVTKHWKCPATNLLHLYGDEGLEEDFQGSRVDWMFQKTCEDIFLNNASIRFDTETFQSLDLPEDPSLWPEKGDLFVYAWKESTQEMIMETEQSITNSVWIYQMLEDMDSIIIDYDCFAHSIALSEEE